MTAQLANDYQASNDWWESHRLKYNIALLIAGAVAFVCYAFVVWQIVQPISPEAEITCFTIVFQAFGYGMMMGVANVCFYLGPLVERIVRPRRPLIYRRVAYFAGLAFSVLLPFTVPASLVYTARYHPEWWAP